MGDLWRDIYVNLNSVRFEQLASFTPYCEFSKDGLIDNQDGTKKVYINSFYRYNSIMQPIFRKNNIPQKYKEWYFDILMHYLTVIEFRQGASRREFSLREIWDKLVDGDYGEEIGQIYAGLTYEEQYLIAHTMCRQQITGESTEKFAQVLVEILQDGIVYRNKADIHELVLYINKKKNQDDERKILLMEQLFMPITCELKVIWQRHFAVIGEAQTMEVDEIELL